MEISQKGLLLLFLYSCATGGVLGLIYDAIRVVRVMIAMSNEEYLQRELPWIHRRVLLADGKGVGRAVTAVVTGVCDFTFMIIFAIALILVAYSENMGRMRWLIPTGAMIGFTLYYQTVGRLTRKITHLAAFLVRAVLTYIYTLAALPVKYVIKSVKNRKIKRKESKKGRKVWHIGKKKAAVKAPKR